MIKMRYEIEHLTIPSVEILKRYGVIDLTGNPYGLLMVTGIARRTKREWWWACTCVCGRTCEKPGSHLRENRVTSCGCRRVAQDLTDVEVSGWTVKERAETPKGRAPLWWCEHGCGARRIRSSSSILKALREGKGRRSRRQCACQVLESARRGKTLKAAMHPWRAPFGALEGREKYANAFALQK